MNTPTSSSRSIYLSTVRANIKKTFCRKRGKYFYLSDVYTKSNNFLVRIMVRCISPNHGQVINHLYVRQVMSCIDLLDVNTECRQVFYQRIWMHVYLNQMVWPSDQWATVVLRHDYKSCLLARKLLRKYLYRIK